MKKELMIKAIEDLLDELHMMPDAMGEDSPVKGKMEIMSTELKSPKIMSMDNMDGEQEEDEIEGKPVLGKANAPVASEEDDGEDDLAEDKMEVIKASKKPKHLFEMLMNEGEDDPSVADYLAKKKKARETEAKYKM